MERQEKILRLSERMKVSLEEAARALDEAGGDLLDAALLLERDKEVRYFEKAPSYSNANRITK